MGFNTLNNIEYSPICEHSSLAASKCVSSKKPTDFVLNCVAAMSCTAGGPAK